MTTCRCDRPTRDDAYVCDDCADELGRALGDVTWLVEELETTITKQRGKTESGGGGASAEKPLPYHEAAAEALRNLRALLVLWVRFCSEEGVRSSDPRDGLPEDNLPAMSRWLLWRVDGLTLHDIGPEAHDEITNAVATCRRVIDRAPERQYVGPCACGRDLYRKPGAQVVRCRFCEAEYDADALTNSLRDQIMGRLVTAREGATLLSRFDLETKQATIDKWRERKRLVERGHNTRGHRLYLFDELLTLAAQHAPPREVSA